jgi:hypothetical protein
MSNHEEHQHILSLCEADGLDMTACRAMSFAELAVMWSDYQSDLAEEALQAKEG